MGTKIIKSIRDMNILQIKNGRVEIRKESGTLIRRIGCEYALTAEFNPSQTLIAITTIKGKVQIRKVNGNLVRTIGNYDAVEAEWWSESQIVIYTLKGEKEIRGISGNLISTRNYENFDIEHTKKKRLVKDFKDNLL